MPALAPGAFASASASSSRSGARPSSRVRRRSTLAQSSSSARPSYRSGHHVDCVHVISGFPRRPDPVGRAAAQRAIFHVRRELEQLALGEDHAPTLLCDRGSLDALAYWPHEPASFFEQLGTTCERARYDTVIHLRTPPFAHGYLQNPVRIETPEQGQLLDSLIERAWAGHPHRHFIDCQEDFRLELNLTVQLLREEIAGRCVHELGATPAAPGR